MTLLALDGVACVRGGRLLFEDLTLALEPGGAALVTGPNGVGKSSLLRLVAGLLSPARGRVSALPAALADGRPALDAERPLGRALAFWGTTDAEVLEAFGLVPLLDVPVRLLSTGQRQRAALAQVAASGAPLWLLDEPANGLDTDALATLERRVARHRTGGGGVMVATHIPVALPAAVQVTL